MLRAVILILNLIVAGTLLEAGETAGQAIREAAHILLGFFVIAASLTILWSDDRGDYSTPPTPQ